MCMESKAWKTCGAVVAVFCVYVCVCVCVCVFTGVQLTYNIMLVSAVQQGESVIHTHTSVLQILCPRRL